MVMTGKLDGIDNAVILRKNHSCRRCLMFALIYDTHELDKPDKRVLSLHKSRKTAEKALEKRMIMLGRRVWDCNTRIVWLEGKARRGDLVTANGFSTWKPGENIPYGETHPDCD
jgi:hypothetical protein